MKKIIALVLLLLASAARAADCPQPSGFAFAVQFKGFPEYSEEPIVMLQSQPHAYIQENIVHPELENAFAFGSWYQGTSCANGFMYMDPYSNQGGVLFPSGSKYEKYQLRWSLLCADIKECNTYPYTFDIRDLTWAGRALEVHDPATGDVIPNQTFFFNEKGKGEGPATLHVAEIILLPNGDRVQGVRMELPGHREVLISVTEQTCP